jgi:hypothetical protein
VAIAKNTAQLMNKYKLLPYPNIAAFVLKIFENNTLDISFFFLAKIRETYRVHGEAGIVKDRHDARR